MNEVIKKKDVDLFGVVGEQNKEHIWAKSIADKLPFTTPKLLISQKANSNFGGDADNCLSYLINNRMPINGTTDWISIIPEEGKKIWTMDPNKKNEWVEKIVTEKAMQLEIDWSLSLGFYGLDIALQKIAYQFCFLKFPECKEKIMRRARWLYKRLIELQKMKSGKDKKIHKNRLKYSKAAKFNSPVLKVNKTDNELSIAWTFKAVDGYVLVCTNLFHPWKKDKREDIDIKNWKDVLPEYGGEK